MRLIFLICLLFSTPQLLHAQLILNEVSQGNGSQEYVEFVVMGAPTCQTPVPTADLRGVVIDDNNGYFAAGSGTGIATGAIRFANIPFWASVPQGTIILIYSDTDQNPLVPADDNSLSDGNCTLIFAVNSNLLEGQGSTPSTSDPTYPGNGSWVVGAGTWSQIAMSNSNDSFQIRQSITSPTPSYSVSWGNNTTGAQISFAQASSSVFSFINTSNNDPLNQANWFAGAVGTDETPGLPNSAENELWIGSMNPQCSVIGALTALLTPTNSACGANCTGSITTSVSGGNAPYTYQWSNGFTTPNINNLCPATYTLTVTDASGCTTIESIAVGQTNSINVQALVSNESCDGYCDGGAAGSASGGSSPYSFSWSNGPTSQSNPNLCPGQYILTVTDQMGCTGTTTVTVFGGNSTPNASIPDPGTHYEDETAIQLTAVNSGGTWTSSCGTCVSGTGIFDPLESGLGTFEVCYTLVSANGCSATNCDSITITTVGCSDEFYYFSESICEGDTATINGVDYTEVGTFQQVYPLASGCDSIITIYISLCIDTNYSIEIPNVFTPNGDQVNDIWEAKTTGLTLVKGNILNRWGNLMKELTNSDLSWTGVEDNEGVYFYFLEFQNAVGETIVKQGFIELIR